MPAAASNPATAAVVALHQVGIAATGSLLGRFGLRLTLLPAHADIPVSYWGAPEAGLAAGSLFVRPDTPVHSVLHETSHYVCMSSARRAALFRDAGGDDMEECAVCYLQVLLADLLPLPMNRARMLEDMDSWGYCFRESSTANWLAGDGREARSWLRTRQLVDLDDHPTFRLNR